MASSCEHVNFEMAVMLSKWLCIVGCWNIDLDLHGEDVTRDGQ